MSGWTWVALPTVLALHEEHVAEHGGGGGLRDEDRLHSALARPRNRADYDPGADAATLAAAYAFGIARNHPFIDGNRRTALVTAELFLALNGLELAADNLDCVVTFWALAAGEIDEDRLAAWFRAHIRQAE